jgi:hypothetical protein
VSAGAGGGTTNDPGPRTGPGSGSGVNGGPTRPSALIRIGSGARVLRIPGSPGWVRPAYPQSSAGSERGGRAARHAGIARGGHGGHGARRGDHGARRDVARASGTAGASGTARVRHGGSGWVLTFVGWPRLFWTGSRAPAADGGGKTGPEPGAYVSSPCAARRARCVAASVLAYGNSGPGGSTERRRTCTCPRAASCRRIPPGSRPTPRSRRRPSRPRAPAADPAIPCGGTPSFPPSLVATALHSFASCEAAVGDSVPYSEPGPRGRRGSVTDRESDGRAGPTQSFRRKSRTNRGERRGETGGGMACGTCALRGGARTRGFGDSIVLP